MSHIYVPSHWVPVQHQLTRCDREARAYHARIQGTLFGRAPDVLLIGVIQVWRRDFDFGYTNDILRCERLKLNVLSDSSASSRALDHWISHSPWYVRRDIALVILVRRPKVRHSGVRYRSKSMKLQFPGNLT